MSTPATSKPGASSTLLNELITFMRRYVVFADEHQPVALALWVMHTHAFEAAEATPYPLITSPEKRSGKSRLLEVLDLLVARPWLVSGVTEAVLFRKIEQDEPTLLLDEVDAIFGVHAEKTEPIRAVINSGNRRGGFVARCVKPHYKVVDFSVFCPKCLAGIDTGTLPETIRDRAIPIALRRKLDEKVERFRRRQAAAESETLVADVEAWAEANTEALAPMFPEVPEDLNDRATEGWEPLLSVAELIGGEWVGKARSAAVKLSGEVDLEEDSWGVQLLADLEEIWDLDELGYTLFSSELVAELNGLPDRIWATWGRNRKFPGFNQRDLAQHLRRYGIKPKTVRIGDETRKGYQYDQFTDAWARYVPKAPAEEEEE